MGFQNGELVRVRKNNNAAGNLFKATIVSSTTRELTNQERGAYGSEQMVSCKINFTLKS